MKGLVKLTFHQKKTTFQKPRLITVNIKSCFKVNDPRVTWKVFIIHFAFFIIQFMFLEQVFCAQVIHFGIVCHFWVLSDNNAAKSIKNYYFLNLKFRLRHDSHLLLLFFLRVTLGSFFHIREHFLWSLIFIKDFFSKEFSIVLHKHLFYFSILYATLMVNYAIAYK